MTREETIEILHSIEDRAADCFTENKRKEMKEISIIINGVRYDSEPRDAVIATCRHCEMKSICSSDMGNLCDVLGYDIIFRKSDKKFE